MQIKIDMYKKDLIELKNNVQEVLKLDTNTDCKKKLRILFDKIEFRISQDITNVQNCIVFENSDLKMFINLLNGYSQYSSVKRLLAFFNTYYSEYEF